MQKFRGRPMLRIRHRIPSFVIPFILTIAMSLGLFRYLSRQLSPIIETVAENNAKNLISLSAASAVNDCLSSGQFTYHSFVDTATHADGRIVSLSLRPAESAQFKNAVIKMLTKQLENISSDALEIPIGTLTGELLFSALGPSVRVRVQSIGNVMGNYQNEFSAAGINQTRHSVYLDLSITMNLLIPGKIITINSVERVCVAETIIIGEVPDTYLNLQKEVN